jgi:HlyD family type I secretion membrane fusion protein
VSKLLDFARSVARSGSEPPGIPDFDGPGAYSAPAVRLRMRRPIVAGSIVVLVLVFGLLLWATLASINGAVLAAGTVRVENNSKQIRHLEPGIIRQILVREGQRVRQGELLIRFDDVAPKATAQVYQSAYDSARAQVARFQAEAANAAAIDFPAELLRRASEPQVAALIATQRNLFLTRMVLYRSQSSVLRSQVLQLENQISGLRAQVASTNGQAELINQELAQVRELNEQGYAPRSRLLALQRNAVALTGQRGSQLAEIARAQQAIGETRIQLAQLEDRRQTEAAEGLRTAQGQITEVEPRLGAVLDSLKQTEVRAPVDGYVFNLTQFTEGGVATGGERLMDIVPVNGRLIITARVHPNDITDVKVGMPARVTLTAYNPRTTPTIGGEVILVSADAATDEATRETYYVVQVKVEPGELATAGPGVRLNPGMPAQVAIVTSQRTIMDYLLGPLIESMQTSLRER